MSQKIEKEDIIQEEKEEIEEGEVCVNEPVVLNSEELMNDFDSISDDMVVTDFTAPKSNINHGHDTKKHDVRDRFNVRDEFVSEFFEDYGIVPNDHAALWLMSYKKQEAISHNEKIFKDTSDRDSTRWSSIEQSKKHAPVSPKTQKELKR